MESFTIGTPKNIDIKEEILNSIPEEVLDNISITNNIDSIKDRYTQINFNSDEELYVKSYFISSMTDYIIENYEQKIINKIINSDYFYLSHVEKSKILSDVLNITSFKSGNGNMNEIFCRKRHEIISHSLGEYLKSADMLFLEGFIRFRLGDYWSELEELVYECVEKHLMQQEYEEFVNLLKYFVNSQLVKIPFLSILSSSDGKHKFYDNMNVDITDECTIDFQSEIASNEINYDDLLISTLIVLSPQKILWHNSDKVINSKLIETVTKVFGTKVEFCSSCDFCKNTN